MLTTETIYIFESIDGEIIKVPEFVITLYMAHNGIGGGRMNNIPVIKWLRVNLGLGLKDAKTLHELLISQIKRNL